MSALRAMCPLLRLRWCRQPRLQRLSCAKRCVRLEMHHVLWTRMHRIRDHRGHYNEKLGLIPLPIRAGEERTKDGDVLEQGNAVLRLLAFVVHQTGDDEALISLHIYSGLHMPRAQGGNLEARDLDRVAEVQTRDFGTDVKPDETVAHNFSGEVQLHSEFAPDNRDRWDAAGSVLCFWIWDLGAREKARGILVAGDEGRLCENSRVATRLIGIQ